MGKIRGTRLPRKVMIKLVGETDSFADGFEVHLRSEYISETVKRLILLKIF